MKMVVIEGPQAGLNKRALRDTREILGPGLTGRWDDVPTAIWLSEQPLHESVRQLLARIWKDTDTYVSVWSVGTRTVIAPAADT